MKYKRKEIIIIGVIILVLCVIAFYPKFKENSKNDTINKSYEYITITLSGEVLVEGYKLKVKKGTSYGEIIDQIYLLTNDYSVINLNLNDRFYEDTILNVLSNDSNKLTYDNEALININTASKEDLVKIYGIGDKRSEKILEYRLNKKIETFEELKEVIGVSDAIMDKIKEQAILQ